MTSRRNFSILGVLLVFSICSAQERVVCSECFVCGFCFSVQWGLVLEVTLLPCWLTPGVITGSCASITACDSVDIIGNLLVPLKLFSVRVFFFFFFKLAGN